METIESDSEPSCDNFDGEELKDMFVEVLTQDELKQIAKEKFKSSLKVVLEESVKKESDSPRIKKVVPKMSARAGDEAPRTPIRNKQKEL